MRELIDERKCGRPRAPVPQPEGCARSSRSGGALVRRGVSDVARGGPRARCAGAPAQRRANPAEYLNARAGRAPSLLVGEAMGYAGGRFSGIAFTAERTLTGWGPPSTRPRAGAPGASPSSPARSSTASWPRAGRRARRGCCSGTSCPRTRTGRARRSRTGLPRSSPAAGRRGRAARAAPGARGAACRSCPWAARPSGR